MIEKKDLNALPFVDGVPDPVQRPDQERIDWVKNGECISGAETSTSNEGSLNKAGVSIQKNVEEVQDNVYKVKSSLDETIDIVNRHSDIISQSEDNDLIQTVKKHTDEIETLNFAVTQNADRFDSLAETVEKHTNEIGVVPSHDTSERTIRDELEWQKTEMGSYPGFDYNGKPNVDSRGTGMKNRIINNSMAISQHNARLNELENDWQSSDIGTLTKEVQNLRVEMGPASDKILNHPVYERVKNLETARDKSTNDISEIETQIGKNTFPRENAETLVSLVDLNQATIKILNAALENSNDRILVIEEYVGTDSTPDTILYNQKVVMKDVSDLYSIVGKSNSEGLRYSVAILETEIGSDAEIGTVKNRILLTEQGIRDLKVQLKSLSDAIDVDGSDSGTITDRVSILELQLNGDENSESEFEKTGVYTFVEDLYNTKLVQDVSDDKIYARTSGGWKEIGTFDLVSNKRILIANQPVMDLDTDLIFGVSGVELDLKSSLKNADIRDKVSISVKDEQQVIASDLAVYEKTDSGMKISIGATTDDLDLLGKKVTINGLDILQDVVEDVNESGTFLREDGAWKSITGDFPLGGITSPTGTKVFSNTDSETVLGSEIPLNIVGLKTAKVAEDFEISSSDSSVLKLNENSIVAGKALYVNSDRVITSADDAPSDDNYYARYKGTWAKVTQGGGGSGGFPDVPNDHKSYVRKDQSWLELGNEPITMFDSLPVQWRVNENNLTGISYSSETNKITVGGSGAVISIDGNSDSISFIEGASILQKVGNSKYTVLTTDTDKNLILGDKDNTSVIIRSNKEPQIRINNDQFKIWHSGDDAKHDGQLYSRKDGLWVVSTVNRTQDVVLNNGVGFKVIDTKNKMMTLATSGADGIIELGDATAGINIRSVVKSINLDNKVNLTSGSNKVNLIGLNDDSVNIGFAGGKIGIQGSELSFNGNKVITSADDAPSDGFKYSRQNKGWAKVYGYGADAPTSVGAKEGDIYFQYM